MPNLEPSSREDVPPETVELDALSVLVEAYVTAEGKKKGLRLLRSAADIMARRERGAAALVEFIPAAERDSRAQVRRQTAAWFRKCLPAWFAKLDAD